MMLRGRVITISIILRVRRLRHRPHIVQIRGLPLYRRHECPLLRHQVIIFQISLLLFVLVAVVLKPDFNLRRGHVQNSRQVLALRRGQIPLSTEGLLQFVHLTLCE